jgi:Protein of unknown function (DUF2917)
MTEHVIKLMSLGRPALEKCISRFGTVNFERVASFPDLVGESVRCTSGYLWITVENDGNDHVIEPGQAFLVPTPGKVIVGGKGGYAIGQETPAALAV